MKEPIDFLIVNNVPSFYKINLYNEIAKRCKIHVIFVALTNQVVISKTFQDDIHFSYDLISEIQIEKRNKWKSILRLFIISSKYNYKKIIYGGYNDLEERLLMFVSPKSKNCLQFESSIRESNISGLYCTVKKIIFNRFSTVLPSGNLQTAVFESLDYKGVIIETKGVGIFDKIKHEIDNYISMNRELKYLFVGRLISVKNIEFLIRVFNKTGKPLTIVGAGILEDTLKLQANSNIIFTGFIPNNQISELYSSHDVFILPSISETWGLVVEESIYYGLPVIVSDAVGCYVEMVKNPNTGVIFSPTDENSLLAAIDDIETNYNKYKSNCLNFNFEERDNDQINSYLKLLAL